MEPFISMICLLLMGRGYAWSTGGATNMFQTLQSQPVRMPMIPSTKSMTAKLPTTSRHMLQLHLYRNPTTSSIPVMPAKGYRSHTASHRTNEIYMSPDDMDPEELLEYLNEDGGLASSFQEYRKEKLLKDYIRGCPVFSDVSDGDCTRLASRMIEVDVEPGQVLIQMGSVDKGGMYFVKSGTFDCLGESDTLLTSYEQPGEYFGELSLVFSGQPRAATIVATSRGKVYRLDKTVFLESLRESKDTAALFDTARQILLKKYSTTRLRDVLPEVRLDEIVGLLLARLQLGSNERTYKKLFTFTMGSALTIMASLWSPRMKTAGIGNWPQLLDLSTGAAMGSERVLPLRLVASLLTATSIFGVLSHSSNNDDITGEDQASDSSRSSRSVRRSIANKLGALATTALLVLGPDPRKILLQTLICLAVNQLNFVGSKQQHAGTSQIQILPVATSILLAYEAARVFLRPILL